MFSLNTICEQISQESQLWKMLGLSLMTDAVLAMVRYGIHILVLVIIMVEILAWVSEF